MHSFRVASLAASLLALLGLASLALPTLAAPVHAAKPPQDNTATIVAQTPIVDENTPTFLLQADFSSPAGFDYEAEISVRVATRTPINREDLEDWENGKTLRNLSFKTVATKPKVHLSEKPTLVTFEIPKADLPLNNPDQWGPRPVEIIATPDPDSVNGTREADLQDLSQPFSDRSYLFWKSGAQFEPSKLLILAPVVVSATDTDATFNPESSVNVLPSRRYQELCLAAAKYPLTLAYDPLLLVPELSGQTAAKKLLQEVNSPLPTPKISDPPSLQEDTERLGDIPQPSPASLEPLTPLKTLFQSGKCGSREAFYLLPEDLSLSYLGLYPTEKQAEIQATARELDQELAEKLPNYQSRRLAWPSSENAWFSLTAQQYADELDYWESSDQEPPLVIDSLATTETRPETASYTPDARRLVVAENNSAPGWVADLELSQDFAAKAPSFRGSQAKNLQELLAEIAVMTRQRPFDSRLFVITLPRDFYWTSFHGEKLSLLQNSGIVSFPNPSEVRPTGKEKLTSLPPETLPPKQAEYAQKFTETELGHIDNYIKLGTQVSALSSTLGTQNQEPGKLEHIFAKLALSEARTSRTEAKYETALENHLLHLVKAQPVSVINLIDKEAKIPVSVANGLDAPVKVKVNLKAQDTRLQFDQSQTLTIPALSTAQAHIPVKAVGHGDVEVTVMLTNSVGQPIGETEQIQVRVRAEWESTGTYVVAVALVVVLVFGIGRKIIRGRRSQGEPPNAPNGPDTPNGLDTTTEKTTVNQGAIHE